MKNHYEREFQIAENQALWNQYEAAKIEEINNSGREVKTPVKQIVAQYKTMLLVLEKQTGKQFKDIVPADIEALKAADKNTSHIPHVTAFFINVVSKGWISVNSNLIAYLIPAEYRQLANLLIDRVSEDNTEVIANHNSTDIKAIRESIGISQKDFSAQLGIGEKRLRAYEKGQIECPADILDKIMSYNKAA